MKRTLSFECLEGKLMMSSICLRPAQMVPVTAPDDLPPPNPEPDPGPLPADDPIVYPPTPESGPVGPG